ncbi:MAG: hypothetical protein ACRDRH_07630 [Pseudonocardia sp.]
MAGDSVLPWGEQLRRWREDVKLWSQQELVDQLVRLAFETKEDRGTRLDVRLIGKWETGAVRRPQSVYRRLLAGLGAPIPAGSASAQPATMPVPQPAGNDDDTGNVLNEQQHPPRLPDRETADPGGHSGHSFERVRLLQVGTQPGHTSMGADAHAVDEEDNVERRRLLQDLTILGAAIAASPSGIALETIRASVSDALMATDRDVQYWEERVVEYGYTYQPTPPQELVVELAADLVSVSLIMGSMRKYGATHQHPEWCRVTSALSGIMAKTLSNLGRTEEARQWWRTAQETSDTSGDIGARLWVRGEKLIHGLYEQSPLPLVLRQASDAIDLARGHPCSGLAHASTARAQALAVAGGCEAAREELARTEDILNRLPSHISNDLDSIHGWGETRLRYTETWVHAYSGDAVRTDAAAEQAKALYPAENYRTPVQIELLQAFVRTQSGDVTEGIRHAHATFVKLPPVHRTTMIIKLAQRVLQPVAAGARKRADVTAYRELLAFPRTQTEIKS